MYIEKYIKPGNDRFRDIMTKVVFDYHIKRENEYVRAVETALPASRVWSYQYNKNAYGTQVGIFGFRDGLDGKTYAEILELGNGKRFFVNDFEVYDTTMAISNRLKASYAPEDLEILSREYTKMMIWQNFNNYEEYCHDFVTNRVSINRGKVKKMTMEKRIEETTKVKNSANNYLNSIKAELCDDLMFYHLFKSDIRNLDDINLSKLAGIVVDGELKVGMGLGPEKLAFFKQNMGYVMGMVARKLGNRPYGENAEDVMTSRDMRKILYLRENPLSVLNPKQDAMLATISRSGRFFVKSMDDFVALNTHVKFCDVVAFYESVYGANYEKIGLVSSKEEIEAVETKQAEAVLEK